MLSKILFDRKGSYTLEASLVIPVILTVILGIMFFSIYLYEKLALLDTAVYSARQTAAAWDNSRKDIETGSFRGDFRTDGLYWRITDDYSESSLVKQKTDRAAALINTRLQGDISSEREPADISVTFSNSLIQRTVSVNISRKTDVSPFLPGSLINSLISGSAEAAVTEPVEFIRNWELTTGYLNEAKDLLGDFAAEKAARSDTGTIVASVQSNVNGKKVYHYPGCRHIGNIKQENIIEFSSVDEANARGYHICVDCAKTIIGRK
ncbi:TadE family protein [Phosphitispora sp. TUW77]|uniref:TadE family protein n=1 Tax=Phosphitispora sp. TUW77 TaxID=3152361 RepID=UPI003AB3D759